MTRTGAACGRTNTKHETRGEKPMGENFLADIPMTQHGSIQVHVPQISAGTDKKYPILRCPHKMKVVAAYVIFQAGITGADTNTFTAKLLNGSTDGSGTTLIASKAYTNGVDATALDPESLTLTSTATDLICDAGDVLEYFSDQAGAGLQDEEKIIQIDYQLQ